MTDELSPRLNAPMMTAGQAQKHVTHNEAIMVLDALAQLSVVSIISTPPVSPAANTCYIIGVSPTGVWAGKANQIARFQDGVWVYSVPKNGWRAWVQDITQLYIYNGTTWVNYNSVALNNVPMLGVNATANSTTKFISKSDSHLFDQVSGSTRVNVNKAATGDTASFIFQKNFSGRAEFGLLGDDNFAVKISADGTSWKHALSVENTGRVSFPSGVDMPQARNLLINGAFDVWQRGISTSTNVTYGADRWWFLNEGIGSASFSRVDISNLGLGSQYCARVERTSGTAKFFIGTTMETIDLKKLIGKTLTLSFLMRKGSGLSANVEVLFSTQNQEAKFGTIIDNASFVISNASLSTNTFTKFSKLLTIPTNSAALGLKLEFGANQAGAANTYIDIAQVQLEIGNYPTNFDSRVYGTELQLCKRYYQKLGGDASTDLYVTGYSTAGGIFVQSFILPVEMRATPTFTKFGTWFVSNSSQPNVGAISTKLLQMYGAATTTGVCAFASTDSTQYVTLNAEL